MGVATTVRDAANIKRANENETRREMIAMIGVSAFTGRLNIFCNSSLHFFLGSIFSAE